MRQHARTMTATFFAAIAAVTAWPSDAPAAPQQLVCALSNAGETQSSANQSITVIFDDTAKTLLAQEGSQNYSFGDVSISNIAISGSIAAVSLGIDRSSLGMVWQQYEPDKVITQFGQCRSNPEPGAKP